MSAELEKTQAELKEYEEQLEIVQSSLSADPDNAELQALQTELEGAVSLFREAIAELQPAEPAAAPAPAPKEPSPPPEKWSKEKHPAYQAGYRKPAASDDAPAAAPAKSEQPTYKVNDMVLAKWVSGDKSFYPARITSITGSAAAPVYYVTFKSYNTSETLRSGDIRPLQNQNQRKRGHDAMSSSSPSPAVASAPAPPAPAAGPERPAGPNTAGVISASPAIDAAALESSAAAQAQRTSAKVSDGPARPAKAPKKIKNKKELETGKARWQEFAAKGGKGARAARKESMFRTGEGVNARVGFTGSGHQMRKHDARSRHVHRIDDDAY